MPAWRLATRGTAHAWHCDHFGHLSARYYASYFDDASFQIWPVFGLSMSDIQARHGVHTVSARTTINFILELKAGAPFLIETAFVKVGSKSVAFQHQMLGADTGTLHATADMIEVFFDVRSREACVIPPDVKEMLEPWVEAATGGDAG